MKRYLILTIIVAFMMTYPVRDLNAEEEPPPAEQDVSATAGSSEIASPDAEGVIPSIVHDEDISKLLKMLGVICNKNIVPSRQVRGPVSVNLFNVTLKEALDAILAANGFAWEEKGPFIFVYTAKEYEEMKAAARKTESQTFHLNYMPVKDAENLIGPLLSDAGEVTTTPEANTSGSGSGEDWAGANYLMIVDYPENIESIGKLLHEIDKRPPQVLIEATIMVASLDDTNELGIDFNVLGGVDFTTDTTGVINRPGSGFTTSAKSTSDTTGDTVDSTLNVSGTTVGAAFGTNGLNIGVVKGNIGLFINALESITDVVTLGNPKVLTLNRQSGKVIVGKRDGYMTTEVSATTATQTVEFLETGTQLSFRPFVSDDGYIRMELNPSDSDGGVSVLGDFTLPSETTAEVTTNVLVKDGHTIVIGGLFRERTEVNRSQVPLAGNIPIIGNLFRSTADQNKKEEVIFLITPHIVQEEAEYAVAEEVMQNIDTMVIGAREGMQWHSRERLAAAHYNRARKNQVAGNIKNALWNAKLATHVSPQFLDALKLRNELRGQKIYQGNYNCTQSLMQRLIEADNK